VAFIGCGGTTSLSSGGHADFDGSSDGGGAAGRAAAGGMAGIGPSVGGANAAGGAGGIAGSGGIADGAAGSAGVTDAGGSSTGTCVNVSGGGPEPWYNLTIVGTQFNADEGQTMRIVVASQTPYRVGIADLPVVGGAFTLSMPKVLNAGLYMGITLYVDRNHDNMCQTDEHVWGWATSAVMGDLRYGVTPDKLCDPTFGCRPRPMQYPCLTSGDPSLMAPLPCTP
jgi:hypothetical protein